MSALESTLQRVVDLMLLERIDARKYARCDYCNGFATVWLNGDGCCAACYDPTAKRAHAAEPVTRRWLAPTAVQAAYREALARLELP